MRGKEPIHQKVFPLRNHRSFSGTEHYIMRNTAFMEFYNARKLAVYYHPLFRYRLGK